MQRRLAWLAAWLVMLGGLTCWKLTPAIGSELWVVEPGAPHCGKAWPFQHLVANLHNHTIPKIDDHTLVHGYAKETERAREMFVQVFGISDHDSDLSRELMLQQRTFARNESRADPPFVVLAGWEWTIGSLVPGKDQLVTHVNGFGCSQLIRANGALAQPGDLIATNMETLYQQAAKLGRSGEAVFQFNHCWAGTDHFLSMAHSKNFALVRQAFALFEVDSGLTDSLRYGLIWFHRALQEGWWVAPTINNDTAGGTTRLNWNRMTGVWVDKVAFARDPQQAVLQALRARRCYARRAEALLQFGVSANGQFAPMGSSLEIRPTNQIEIEFLAASGTEFHNPKAAIYLIRPGTVDRQVLHLTTVTAPITEIGGHTEIKVPDDTICLYLGFENKSGVMISAPVWLTKPATTQPINPPPAAGADQLRFVVAADHKLRLAASSYADWHQMLVMRRNGGIVHTAILTQSGQRQEYRFTNKGKEAVIVTLEPYHRASRRNDWQATRLMMPQHDSQPPLLLFEDGDDRDYNDLIVEIYRE